MATLQTRLEVLASAIGTDVKSLRGMIGILANLTTDAKGNLTLAINELNSKIGGTQSSISSAVGSMGDKTIVEALTKLYVDIGTQANARLASDQALQSEIDEINAYNAQLIKDTAVSGDVTHVYSADKVLALMYALEAKILGGMVPETLDTIKELASYLSDSNIAGGIVQQLSKKVDASVAQLFTASERLQARQNIEAAADAELQSLVAGIGAYDTDYVAIYTAAKA